MLLAGAFDIDAARGREFGQALGVAPDRCYPDYASLFAGEAAREDGIEAVSVATPNNTHFAICRAALNAGLHVVCEKPLCFTVEEADELEQLSRGEAEGCWRHLRLRRASAGSSGQGDDRRRGSG
ncbi:Uncharacterized oxidoreductase ydgJ [Pantoea agglomerans]|uniref:Uncharacterized oxidoreductase ydgJ n=1 Tax=Enterobacter agglomerans TaxID=549 RepID=A0A379ALY1_ENTAG|nr:Uncharacterized oxidoreductase ydgJ [Pantoea agglomerans]